MSCITGKRIYETEAEAETALVDHHSRFNHRPGSGPVNFYMCRDCGKYHFTSQGTQNPILQDPDVRKGISLDQDARYWERKLR